MEAEGTSETMTPHYQITSPNITDDTAYERSTVSITKPTNKVLSSHTCVNSFKSTRTAKHSQLGPNVSKKPKWVIYVT
jgi:hypothetical protein